MECTYHSCSKPALSFGPCRDLNNFFFAFWRQSDCQVDREDREEYKNGEVPKSCTFENDTQYEVEITDKNGTRVLKPGKLTTNCNISNSHEILVLKVPKKDMKIDFPSSRFNNSTYKISQIFANQMKKN